MRTAPLPSVPWQFTGNHWLTIPCIHPADGGIRAVGMLHRGAKAAVEFAGGADFLDGGTPALLRPILEVNGERVELGGAGMAWEQALEWLPTYVTAVGDLVVRGTIFAPFGRDADAPGAVYALSLENRAGEALSLRCGIEGTLGHRQMRVSSARSFDDAHRVRLAQGDVVVLEGAALPGVASLAIAADGVAEATVLDGELPSYVIRRALTIQAGERVELAFYLAASPEGDGAQAAVAALRRRGWQGLLGATRDALRSLDQSTGHAGTDRLVNRNLLFAYFYGVGRALDDAHFYMVRSRAPWNGRGTTYRDWESLMWTLPAVQLADPPLARELLLRACELHGYAPGMGEHYMDGTLFAPGFSLEGAAAYPLAVDRYIRGSGDDPVVEEPALADTLYLACDDISARRDRRLPLYSTEVDPVGEPVAHAFTLHGNAVVALAFEVLRRMLDERSAAELEEPGMVRAAMERHFVVEVAGGGDGGAVFVPSSSLSGEASSLTQASPATSPLWLPMYDAVSRDDPTYRRTVGAVAGLPGSLLERCARLIGPEAAEALVWLRNAPLDRGVAAEVVDVDGRAVSNGGDAALAGLVAYCAWYTVHALGVRR